MRDGDQAWPTDEQWARLREADRLEEVAPRAEVVADASGSVSLTLRLAMPSMLFVRLEPAG